MKNIYDINNREITSWPNIRLQNFSVLKAFAMSVIICSVFYTSKLHAQCGSLTTINSGGTTCGGGIMFDITALSQDLNIDSIATLFAVTGAQSVTVHYKLGTFSGFETDPSAWTSVGTYTVNVANTTNFFAIPLSNPIEIEVSQVYGIYLEYNARYSGSANTFSDAELELVTGTSHCSAFDGCCNPRTFNGVVYYCPSIKAPIDAGVVAIDSPAAFCTGTHDIVAKIKNFGSEIIDTVTVEWELDGAAQPSVLITSPVDTIGGTGNNTLQVTLGSNNFLANQAYTVKAWTTDPNNEPDTVNFNDTTEVTLMTSLSGTIALGPSATTFNTFTDAVNALNQYGVCGPVVFEVEDGTYNESLQFNSIAGADNVNTITFQSASGDSSQVVLTYAGTSTTDNYTIQFNGGSYLRFHGITIENTAVTYSRVLDFTGNSSYNEFTNCVIKGNTTTTSTATSRAVIYSVSGTGDDYNLFMNNDILGGSYAFYWYGTSGSHETGTGIINNNIADFYYQGLHIYYEEDLVISGNSIIPRPTYTGTLYRMYIYYTDNLEISNNHIAGENHGYGMLLSNAIGDPINPGMIYNNSISIGISSSINASYGIYMLSSSDNMVAFNSIYIDSDGSASSGIYISSGTGYAIYNNNIYNSGPGYGLYYAAAVENSDHNNVYAPNGNYGYSGSTQLNLSAWQTATNDDMNSYETDPVFPAYDDLRTCNDTLMAGLAIAGINSDLDGMSRPAQDPSIGAYEIFAPVSNFDHTTSFLTGVFNSTATYADGISWDFGDGNTSTQDDPLHLYSEEGDYLVCLTAYNLCTSDVFCKTITIAITTGIEESGLFDAIQLYPNPSSGLFHLNFSNIESSTLELSVFDVQGRMVWNKELRDVSGQMMQEINMKNQANGIYFLRIQTDKEIAAKKLSVNK